MNFATYYTAPCSLHVVDFTWQLVRKRNETMIQSKVKLHNIPKPIHYAPSLHLGTSSLMSRIPTLKGRMNKMTITAQLYYIMYV